MAKIKNKRTRQDPALLFYTSDFLVRTIDMTYEQKGRLITLICLQHQNGHLSEATMLSICNGEDEKVFSKYCIDGQGLFFNEEVENEMKRRAGISVIKTDAANIRWAKWKEEKEQAKSIGENGVKKSIPEHKDVNTHITEYDD